MDGIRNHTDPFLDMIDQKIDQITEKDYSEPQELIDVMQEAHEHGVDTVEWSPLKDPMPDQGYMILYQGEETPKIQEIRGRELSYPDFLFNQMGDRRLDLDQKIETRMDFLKTDPGYFNDCVDYVKQDFRDSILSDAWSILETKEGTYNLFWKFDHENDTLSFANEKGPVSADQVKQELADRGFFEQKEKVQDVETQRLDQAYFAEGDKLDWVMHRILDEKAHDGIDASSWTMEGRRGSFEVNFTRNDRQELVMQDDQGRPLDRHDISAKAQEIGLDDRLNKEYRDERDYAILDTVKTAPSPKIPLLIVAGERGRNHAGPIRWEVEGKKETMTFLIDGKSDGTPILKDDQNNTYDLSTMESKLGEMDYFEKPEPDPVVMFALEAKEEPQSLDQVHNEFFPEDRDKLDPKDVAEIRETNPLYGFVDGKVDVTKPCSRIQIDHQTVKNLLGDEFRDTTIKDARAYIQNGRAMEVDGVKFGITNRVYLDVDIDRNGESANVRYQSVIRTDGAYIYGYGKTDGHLLHYKFPEPGEKYVSLDRLELSNPTNWFGKEVEGKVSALEKAGNAGELEKLKSSPTGQGLEAYQEARDFLKTETGCDTVSKGLQKLDNLTGEKEKTWEKIVEKYNTAVKQVEIKVDRDFDKAARHVVSEQVEYRREEGKLDKYFEKKLDFYINQRNDVMNTRDQLVTYRNTKLDKMYDFQHAYRDASYKITDNLAYGHEEKAKEAVATIAGLDYGEYKQQCADVAKVNGPIAKCESYLNLCDAVIRETLNEMEFADTFDVDQFDAMTSLKEYVYYVSNFTDGTDMRDYSSVYSKDLELIDHTELQEKVDAYNEKQDSEYYKVHIGKDGGLYTSFGVRLSYDYDTNRSVRPHYYAADKNMKIDDASYRYKEVENLISPDGHLPISPDAPMIGRDENADYTNAFNVLRNHIPGTTTQLVDILEQVDRNFLGERSTHQYREIIRKAGMEHAGLEGYRDIIRDILENKEDFEKVMERYEERKEDLEAKAEKMEHQPDPVQTDTKADAVRMVDIPKRMPDMVRAKVDFGGELNIRNSKMTEIEKTASANAEQNGTDADTEKQKLVDGILKDAQPVVDRMKELAGKMNGMVERIGNPQILRTNTFYQQYKMEYDFCSRKLIDSGIAWGDGQVVKEYVSKDMLHLDKMELRNSDYMESYKDRIVAGGDEKIDTDSYLKGSTYDYSTWFRFGDFLAKTIYRPYFSRVERGVDREPQEDRFEKKEEDPKGKEDVMKPEIEKQPEAAVEQPGKPEENAQVSKDAAGGPVDREDAKTPVDQPEDLSNDLPEEQPESVDNEGTRPDKEEEEVKDDAMALEDARLEAEEDKPEEDEVPEEPDEKPEEDWNPDTDQEESEDIDFPDYSFEDDDPWEDLDEHTDTPEDEVKVVTDPDEIAAFLADIDEDWPSQETTTDPDDISDPRADMKEDFDQVFEGNQTTDDIVDKYVEDVFGNESIDYDTMLQAAADSISEKLSDAPDVDRDYYQQASADIAYEISDLDGKPMDNLETIVSAMQDNGISEEDTDILRDQTGDRYEDPGFDPSFDDVEEDPDYVDFPEEDMDLSETEDFLDDLEERADMAQDAIYEAQQDGVDLPEDTLSSVMAEDDLPDDISDLLESLKNQMMENGVTEEDRDAIDKGLYQPEDLDYSQIDFSNDYDD